jgi:hypothetical protein
MRGLRGPLLAVAVSRLDGAKEDAYTTVSVNLDMKDMAIPCEAHFQYRNRKRRAPSGAIFPACAETLP